jgi:ribosomal protein S18 acetylase RimI-like enzyme
MTAELKAYTRADLDACERLASRLWPLGFHPGGLAWMIAYTDKDIVCAYDDGELVGWGVCEDPGVLWALADPARTDAAEAIVAWFVDVVDSPEPLVEVADQNDVMKDALTRRGFVRQPDGRPMYLMRRAAGAPRTSASDYIVRSVRVDELEERVDVHRRAWKPSTLPWADGRAPADPEATSSFDLEKYEAVRDTRLYDEELDLVAVAPDGSFAGCCIVWLDPALGVAEIEPLGVDPAHRNRGVAGALCDEAVARVGDRGGREVVIHSGPNDAYPAPPGAYAKAGFEPIDRGRPYVLDRGQL